MNKKGDTDKNTEKMLFVLFLQVDKTYVIYYNIIDNFYDFSDECI